MAYSPSLALNLAGYSESNYVASTNTINFLFEIKRERKKGGKKERNKERKKIEKERKKERISAFSSNFHPLPKRCFKHSDEIMKKKNGK